MTVSFDAHRPGGAGIASLAALPDNAMLAAGQAGRRGPAVLRFLPDGRLDAAYGREGVAHVPGSEDAQLIARPDGAATVLTQSGQDERDAPALYRLDPRGKPDPTFGGGAGRTALPMRRAWSPAATPDEGTAVAGSVRDGAGRSRLFAVARVRANGALHEAFGRGGVATPFPTGLIDRIAVQRDGRIVAVGNIGTEGAPRPVVIRLTTTGELDRSFGGGDGIIDVPWSRLLTWMPTIMLLDAQDRIVLVSPFDGRMRIARYTPAGTPDTSLGGAGRIQPALRFGDGPVLAAAGADELILVANADDKGALLRVPTEGQAGAAVPLALPFGGGLTFDAAPTVLQGTGLVPKALALRPDRSVILAGSVGLDIYRTDLSASEAALAALRPDGRPEQGFGGPRRPPLRARILLGQPKVVYPGRLRVRLSPRQRGVARLRVSAGGRTIARGVIPLMAARRTAEDLPLTNAGDRLVRRTPRARVTVRLTVSDLAGNRARASYRTTAALSHRRAGQRR